MKQFVVVINSFKKRELSDDFNLNYFEEKQLKDNDNLLSNLLKEDGSQSIEEDDNNYSFMFFNNEDDLISYISKIDRKYSKVHKIFTLDHNAKTVEKTIVFEDGTLKLKSLK